MHVPARIRVPELAPHRVGTRGGLSRSASRCGSGTYGPRAAPRSEVDDGPALARRLPRAGQALGRRLRHAVASHGLTPTSLGVLGVLVAGGPASHRELAAALGVSPGTLTPVVDVLERAGSVTRTRDGADRRVVHVSISPDGRSRFADASAQVTRAFAEHLPQLPADQEAIVRAYLVSLLDALEPTPQP